MGFLFGIWGFICTIFIIKATVELIHEKGNAWTYMKAFPVVWFVIVIVPCLAYIAINQLLKLA